MPEAGTCIIFNPKAGKGQAQRLLEKRLRTQGLMAELWQTQAPGHGVELARQAALAGYAIVAAAGGDGTVHEVANGLLLAQKPNVQFAVLPLGSANDYSHSLLHNFPLPKAETRIQRFEVSDSGSQICYNPAVRTVDVGMIQDPSGRKRYFVCCMGLGLNGAVTLEARRIRRLRGVLLYGLATLRALWYHYDCPLMEIALDGEPARQMPTLMLSALLGRREGGFVMAPQARLDDGLFDLVHSGSLSRLEVLRFLPRLALVGPPENYPKVEQRRCSKIRLKSQAPLTVHLDGEFFCTPKDNVTSLEIHIIPASLKVHLGMFVTHCG